MSFTWAAMASSPRVHCAASGLQHPPAVPIWGPDAITLQPVRSGFPCFGAALVGYVEATRDDDADKNRLCPPTPYGNSRAEWGRMQVLGARAAQSFGAAPDIRDWANGVALNPARIPPGQAPSAALDDVLGRLRANVGPGLARLAELSGLATHNSYTSGRPARNPALVQMVDNGQGLTMLPEMAITVGILRDTGHHRPPAGTPPKPAA